MGKAILYMRYSDYKRPIKTSKETEKLILKQQEYHAFKSLFGQIHNNIIMLVEIFVSLNSVTVNIHDQRPLMSYRAVLAAKLLHTECDIVAELQNRRLQKEVRN